MSSFNDPAAVAHYAAGPLRQVPGFLHMQKMAGILLHECVPSAGNILVLGAGGGLELKAFADNYPDWCFCGVDPSAQMLDLAKRTLGEAATRVDFHEGYIDIAPQSPFDAATCILTLHFIPRDERLRTLTEIQRRLKPGAPLVVAHYSFPYKNDADKAKWLARYAAFAIASGVEPTLAKNAASGIAERLPILTPEQDEALLVEAGFTDVSLFYVGFTFRGWVAYKK